MNLAARCDSLQARWIPANSPLVIWKVQGVRCWALVVGRQSLVLDSHLLTLRAQISTKRSAVLRAARGGKQRFLPCGRASSRCKMPDFCTDHGAPRGAHKTQAIVTQQVSSRSLGRAVTKPSGARGLRAFVIRTEKCRYKTRFRHARFQAGVMAEDMLLCRQHRMSQLPRRPSTVTNVRTTIGVARPTWKRLRGN